MWSDFKAFIAGGNVLDLAVGVMIGGAFATITKSLTEDLSSRFLILGAIPEKLQEAAAAGNYAALKAGGVPMIGYGAFITAIINFLIFAFVIFMIVRWVNKVLKTKVAEAGPTEVDLLTEIRDALKK
jgi:large conductance mechanosensitive channel